MGRIEYGLSAPEDFVNSSYMHVSLDNSGQKIFYQTVNFLFFLINGFFRFYLFFIICIEQIFQSFVADFIMYNILITQLRDLWLDFFVEVLKKCGLSEKNVPLPIKVS